MGKCKRIERGEDQVREEQWLTWPAFKEKWCMVRSKERCFRVSMQSFYTHGAYAVRRYPFDLLS